MNQPMYTEFAKLHRNSVPLTLPNIWDAGSAVLFQAAGARALATSSAALAWSLGYADGGALPRAGLLGAIRRIARVARVPLSVDIEDGYSDDPAEVSKLVAAIAEAGVVGINIEDGAGTARLLCDKLIAVRKALGDRPLFINARTDVYLRGLASGEEAVALTLDRLRAYHSAGADGAFVPGLTSIDEAAQVAAGMPMPLNLMALPGMVGVAALFAAGVRRFSAGPALFQAAYGRAFELARRISEGGEVEGLFGQDLDYGRLNAEFAEVAVSESDALPV